jgi:hypothetical protein
MIEQYRNRTSTAIKERRRAHSAWRMREILGRRFVHDVEQSVLAQGEFDRLLDSVTAREVDPYAAADSVMLRAMGRAPIAGSPLDHVGIAVADAGAVAALFRRLVDLTTDEPEVVGDHRLRFVDAGSATLELVEAASAERRSSRQARRRSPPFLLPRADRRRDRRLSKAGVTFIDNRRGRRAWVANCVHSSVERRRLADRTETAGQRSVALVTFGEFDVTPLVDGSFRLDGGAMFGTVPKPLWERRTSADARNRIPLSTRPLLVRTGADIILIDGGLGGKMSAKEVDIYGIDRPVGVEGALAQHGVAPIALTVVICFASALRSHRRRQDG